MGTVFFGREQEMKVFNELYAQDRFQLVIVYGRRRVGKTTFLHEFCKGKAGIFFSAEQNSEKRNLDQFSKSVFEFYQEEHLAPFSSWSNALSYIEERQQGQRLVLILDEFPYLVRGNKALLSEFQHLIDHRLKDGKLFMVLCGSYMGFMEKEVLSAESPLFGRRTAQLRMQPFDYRASSQFFRSVSAEEKLNYYGAFGGTPLYLSQVRPQESFEENIKSAFLQVTSYLYEEPLLLLRQEVQEPDIYNAIIEAIAGGASKANEISTRTGEDTAKCLKYIRTLCELGILYRETPLGEKESSRKTLYGISDLMFRFWYRYVFPNRTLVETGAQQAVWSRRIAPDYTAYMGAVFEKVCRDFLCAKNARGELPFLFTSVGRWWGTDPAAKAQIEIDLIANDGDEYLCCECKWRNEKTDLSVFRELKRKTDIFLRGRAAAVCFALFSKSGFTEALLREAETANNLLLFSLEDLELS